MRRILATALVAVAAALPAAAQERAVLERGRYLVEVTGACGNCHTPMGPQGPVAGRHLAGGAVFDEPPFRVVLTRRTGPPGAQFFRAL